MAANQGDVSGCLDFSDVLFYDCSFSFALPHSLICYGKDGSHYWCGRSGVIILISPMATAYKRYSQSQKK